MRNLQKSIRTGIIAFTFVLSCTLACFLPLKMFAQPEVNTKSLENISPAGPVHPLVNYGKVRTSTNIDKVITSYYFTIYWEKELEEPIKTTNYYARNEEGNTDTLNCEHAGSYVYQYNEQNKLLYDYYFSPLNPFNEYVKTYYEYDEEGRVVKEVQKIVKPSENLSETFLSERMYDYATVQMTEKGYIFENIEYEFDDQGRLTCMKYLNLGNEVVNKDGKEYCKNACYYTYTDDSYSELVIWTMNYFVLGKTDLWVENTFGFGENGNLEWCKQIESEDGINWITRGKNKVEYVYLNESRSDEIGTTYNLSIVKTNTVVKGLSGEIYISTENATTVQLFDLTGSLVKQKALSVGENRISVSKGGFYIVKVGKESFKVYAR